MTHELLRPAAVHGGGRQNQGGCRGGARIDWGDDVEGGMEREEAAEGVDHEHKDDEDKGRQRTHSRHIQVMAMEIHWEAICMQDAGRNMQGHADSATASRASGFRRTIGAGEFGSGLRGASQDGSRDRPESTSKTRVKALIAYPERPREVWVGHLGHLHMHQAPWPVTTASFLSRALFTAGQTRAAARRLVLLGEACTRR